MNQKLSLICVGLLVAATFAVTSAVPQSGRGLMHGYVAFDDVSYNELSEGKLHAKVELSSTTTGSEVAYKAETDNRGSYDFPHISMGEYVLKISAPGYKTYQTEIYIPSDFSCSLATLMKKATN